MRLEVRFVVVCSFLVLILLLMKSRQEFLKDFYLEFRLRNFRDLMLLRISFSPCFCFSNTLSSVFSSVLVCAKKVLKLFNGIENSRETGRQTNDPRRRRKTIFAFFGRFIFQDSVISNSDHI